MVSAKGSSPTRHLPVLASVVIGVRPTLNEQLHYYLIIWDHGGVGAFQSPQDQITQSGKVVTNSSSWRSPSASSNKIIVLKN